MKKVKMYQTMLNCVVYVLYYIQNRIMDEFGQDYSNAIFLADFNNWINDNAMTSFCSLNVLTSLIDQLTCYKILY